ncbi:FUSC family protein [Kineococcus sp. SYSU DK003]|uniref:FUSC family protein n=1 Tax=Kineococcus sp. SYSU DK003 TaxID=3383124 RepID=UPI003D7C9969
MVSRSLLGHRVLARWPRLGLAARTAISATLAWTIALALPWQVAETYPYYAPLGAVVSSYSTVRSSVANSARAVTAIICGAMLSLLAGQLLGRDLLVVPLLVFAATLLAGWRFFGGQGSWVLTVALFVLTASAEHPVQYAAAYCALTLLGGVVAVGVNALLPEIPLARSAQALHDLATALADQLADLADGLRTDEPPGPDEWAGRLRSVAPVRESLRATREETEESLHGNVRAGRNLDTVRRHHVAGVALENVAVRVEELTELLLEVQNPAQRQVALGVPLRGQTAEVLDCLAALLHEYPDTDGGPARRDALRQQLQRLSAAEAGAEFGTERDRQTAGAVVTALRRCLGALDVDVEDDDPEAVVPAPWRRPDPELPAPPRLRPPGRGTWRSLRTRRR